MDVRENRREKKELVDNPLTLRRITFIILGSIEGLDIIRQALEGLHNP